MRFEVLMAETMKNSVFWGVMPCNQKFTDVSEEHTVSIFRIKNNPRKQQAELFVCCLLVLDPEGAAFENISFFITMSARESQWLLS
jgi:hypothetical protein